MSVADNMGCALRLVQPRLVALSRVVIQQMSASTDACG